MCKNNLDLGMIEINTNEARVPLAELPLATTRSASGTMVQHNQLPSPPRRSQVAETTSSRTSSHRAIVRPLA